MAKTKTETVGVRFTEVDRKELDEIADVLGVPIGSLAREAVERFMPIARERAEERRRIKSATTAAEVSA